MTPDGNDKSGVQVNLRAWGLGLAIEHCQFGPGWIIDVQLGPIHAWARQR